MRWSHAISSKKLYRKKISNGFGIMFLMWMNHSPDPDSVPGIWSEIRCFWVFIKHNVVLVVTGSVQKVWKELSQTWCRRLPSFVLALMCQPLVVARFPVFWILSQRLERLVMTASSRGTDKIFCDVKSVQRSSAATAYAKRNGRIWSNWMRGTTVLLLEVLLNKNHDLPVVFT